MWNGAFNQTVLPNIIVNSLTNVHLDEYQEPEILSPQLSNTPKIESYKRDFGTNTKAHFPCDWAQRHNFSVNHEIFYAFDGNPNIHKLCI